MTSSPAPQSPPSSAVLPLVPVMGLLSRISRAGEIGSARQDGVLDVPRQGQAHQGLVGL
jgi:hypothetical protein